MNFDFPVLLRVRKLLFDTLLEGVFYKLIRLRHQIIEATLLSHCLGGMKCFVD